MSKAKKPAKEPKEKVLPRHTAIRVSLEAYMEICRRARAESLPAATWMRRLLAREFGQDLEPPKRIMGQLGIPKK